MKEEEEEEEDGENDATFELACSTFVPLFKLNGESSAGPQIGPSKGTHNRLCRCPTHLAIPPFV
jgi:hypothetical protein